MELIDLLGSTITIDGRPCTILGTTELARRNGTAALYAVTLTTPGQDGIPVFGALPIVSSPGPRAPTVVHPIEAFDEFGGFVDHRRPFADWAGEVRWTDADGRQYRIDVDGWPVRDNRLSIVDQIARVLDVPPTLDEDEKAVAGVLVRCAGVALVNRDGADRDPADVLGDARERLQALKRAGVHPVDIARCEALIERYEDLVGGKNYH